MPDLSFSHSDTSGDTNNTGTWNSNTGSHNVSTIGSNTANTGAQTIDPRFATFGYDALSNATKLANTPTTSYASTGNYGRNAVTDNLYGNRDLYDAQARTGTNAALYNASLGPGHGYDPLTGTGTPVTAGSVSAGSIPGTDLSGYINPHNREVVDAAASDIDRTRQQQLQSVGSNAVSSGAYGGARQALLEGETNRGATDALARTSAQLREQGFNDATGLATSDMNRKAAVDTGNVDRTLNADQFNQNQDLQRRQADMQGALTAAGIRGNSANTLLGAANTTNSNLMGLDAANYTDFLRQQQDPYQKLNALISAGSSLPHNTSNSSNTNASTGVDTSNVSSGYGYGNNVGNSSSSGTNVGGGISL